jgi:hypothetical protein
VGGAVFLLGRTPLATLMQLAAGGGMLSIMRLA